VVGSGIPPEISQPPNDFLSHHLVNTWWKRDLTSEHKKKAEMPKQKQEHHHDE
jgi:hypothetical protein